jgi:hypothetical protein
MVHDDTVEGLRGQILEHARCTGESSRI